MSSSSTASLGTNVRDHAPTGTALGAASFLVSYALTFAFLVVDGVDTSADGAWRLVGLVLYSAHNVETVGTASAGGVQASRSFNLISNDLSQWSNLGSTVPSVVYYATPVLVLLVAGYLTVRMAGHGERAIGSAAVGGATVAIGYLVLAVVGRFVFQVSGSAFGIQTTIAPDLVTAAVVLGIAYPVIFGAIGGAAGSS